MKELKVIFMGTPTFAVPILKMLNENTTVVKVITQPDKLVGRKKVITPSPVKQYALENNLAVFQPDNLKKDYTKILNTPCDIIITCAYGQKLPQELLNYPPLGCINVHASLLPKYRGGAPIHWCLINGEKETGITIMYMDENMDTGDIIASKKYQILDTDTTETLHTILSIMGADLLKETLPSIINKTNSRTKQIAKEATYGYNITREQEHLDFQKDGISIINQIRGLNSWPLAYFLLNNQEYKVLEAKFIPGQVKQAGLISEVTKDTFKITCQDGFISLLKIKPFGKQIMDIKSYLNGVDKNKLLKSEIR